LNHTGDSELIKKILDGETGLFRILVERYSQPVAAVIKRMLGDCPEAEDVGQETFIRFYRSLGSFRGESGVKTYLIRIAMNLSLNSIKKNRKLNHSMVQIDSAAFTDRDNGITIAERSEIRESIFNALNTLEPGQKSVFILRIIEGYNTRETAKIMDIPEGTVLSRLNRAMEILRKKLVKQS
jgi:RNA polymerase sigma-70 factor (ECF subfamily)